MSDLEEEMRRALFGSTSGTEPITPLKPAEPPQAARARVRRPRIQVTMKVSKEFEGVTELFIYESDSLSTLTAEIDAKAAAKKQKFKYFDVVSVKTVG
ncbi:hypothetical protein [Pseudomonas sp. NA-150]|uniref:hypothetical protein n=1 Tax=Pseudomonas sp. NA-150 TaxID=3367525 RepID=UPI0037C5D9E5